MHNDATTPNRALGLLATIALLVGLVVALLPGTAGALTITVTTTVDGDPGSLRDAIDDINSAGAGPHTVNLASGAVYQLDQCGIGDNGSLELNNGTGPVTINGNGATIEQTCTDARILRYNTSEMLTLNSVTITGGNRDGNAGGVKSFGPVTVNDSTFVGNSAAANGGGLWANDQDIAVNNSTFADNDAGAGDDAIFTYGGEVTATNSTFTGNSAVAGGAVFAVQHSYTFVTMADNEASDSGAAVVAETVDAFGSVFAGNVSPADVCSATLTSFGHNWTDEATCDFADPTDTLDVGGDPLLGALADNGGPTETMLPADASPLVDAIPTTEADCDGTDQRGVSRPQADGCDIGAVELGVTEEPTTTTTVASPTTTVAVAPAQATQLTPAFTG